jgi:hypothetical protein
VITAHAAYTGRAPRGDRTPGEHRMRSGREPMAWAIPKAATMGHLDGPWPSRPLWPWAAVKPSGIVIFSIFHWNYSNLIQFISV